MFVSVNVVLWCGLPRDPAIAIAITSFKRVEIHQVGIFLSSAFIPTWYIYFFACRFDGKPRLTCGCLQSTVQPSHYSCRSAAVAPPLHT